MPPRKTYIITNPRQIFNGLRKNPSFKKVTFKKNNKNIN